MVMRMLKATLMVAGLLVSLSLLAGEFSASVDRTELNEQDTLTLVLRYNEQIGFSSPDLTPLQNDFQILGQQRSNQFRSVNGQQESFTQWLITLTPLRTGTLTIPAITFKGARTSPITLTVAARPAAVQSQAGEEFFFDTQVSPGDNLYVQAQLLYTEKLYYRTAHEEASLSELKVTDARVQPLGEVRQYTTTLNGQRYGVYERRFAIFPEVSGELVIPGQRFGALVRNPYDRWSRGRQINLVSKPLTLQVLPIPDHYPQAPWLAAQNLSIREQFSTPPRRWQAGEAVTRTFILQADGLSGSQLPAVPLPEIPQLRYYPDQISHDDQISAQGLTGQATQAVALVATQGGTLTLPEVRIPWWNTRTATLEYATLPAHTVTIAAPAASTAAEEYRSPDSSPDAGHSVQSESLNEALHAPLATRWLAPLLGLLLALSVLLNLWLLLRRPRPALATTLSPPSSPSLRSLWQVLQQAAQAQDAAALRRAILDWVNGGGLGTPPATPCHSLLAVAALVQPELGAALQALDAQLFSPDQRASCDTRRLLTLLQQAQNAPAGTATAGLYPA